MFLVNMTSFPLAFYSYKTPFAWGFLTGSTFFMNSIALILCVVFGQFTPIKGNSANAVLVFASLYFIASLAMVIFLVYFKDTYHVNAATNEGEANAVPQQKGEQLKEKPFTNAAIIDNNVADPRDQRAYDQHATYGQV